MALCIRKGRHTPAFRKAKFQIGKLEGFNTAYTKNARFFTLRHLSGAVFFEV
jgi:hypothetical protein